VTLALSTRVLAWFAFAGTLCDMLGGLYLGYDLLGGRHGPLGLATRALTYCLFFGLCYGATLGWMFGMIAGVGLGLIIAAEYYRVARQQRLYGSSPLNNPPFFGVARGLVFGTAAWAAHGRAFGLAFGAAAALGQYIVYALHYSPSYDYRSDSKPVIGRRRVESAAMRGLGVGLAGAFAGWAAPADWITTWFGLRIGVVTGTVAFVFATFSPQVEWWVDNLPDRAAITGGVSLVILGFALQSVQYLATVLEIPVK
jgi:hypothetical protein